MLYNSNLIFTYINPEDPCLCGVVKNSKIEFTIYESGRIYFEEDGEKTFAIKVEVLEDIINAYKHYKEKRVLYLSINLRNFKYD